MCRGWIECCLVQSKLAQLPASKLSNCVASFSAALCVAIIGIYAGHAPALQIGVSFVRCGHLMHLNYAAVIPATHLHHFCRAVCHL